MLGRKIGSQSSLLSFQGVVLTEQSRLRLRLRGEAYTYTQGGGCIHVYEEEADVGIKKADGVVRGVAASFGGLQEPHSMLLKGS